MIVVQDNFLPQETFDGLKDAIAFADWKIFDTGEKQFSYVDTPKHLYPSFEMQGHELVVSFIRRAYKGFDNEPRIHADHILLGHYISMAGVLYISSVEEVGENGTKFYEHVNYGLELPDDISDEEHDFVLAKHSNDLTKWKVHDIITGRPNRLLTYNANYFHSKWPHEIEKGERIVLVNFYTENE